jgi:hypothetical protein
MVPYVWEKNAFFLIFWNFAADVFGCHTKNVPKVGLEDKQKQNKSISSLIFDNDSAEKNVVSFTNSSC